jgi:hypothetical protein
MRIWTKIKYGIKDFGTKGAETLSSITRDLVQITNAFLSRINAASYIRSANQKREKREM